MKNIVGLFTSLFRAFEVSEVGGFSIRVVADPNYKNAKDDLDFIKDLIVDPVSTDSDIFITVQMHKPESHDLKYSSETIKDISKRAEAARKNKTPTEISDASLEFLNTAVGKLELSLRQFSQAKEIAATIAKMENEKTIQASHMVEAIQYVCHSDDTVIVS